MNSSPVSDIREAAKVKAIAFCAYVAAKRFGLSAIQCEAIRKKARDDFKHGKSSPARAIADARMIARDLSKGALA